MNGNDHIEVEDLAMFALLLLPEEEATTVRAHLRGCAPCSEELHHVREDLATYAVAVEPVALPPGARERLISSISHPETANSERVHAADSPMAGSVVPSRGPVVPTNSAGDTASRRAGRLLGWTGWAVAAALGVVAWGLRQDRDALQSAFNVQNTEMARLQGDEAKARQLFSVLTGPTAVRVDLTPPKAPALPSARATYDPKSGTLLLAASHLAALPRAKVYELWLIPADGSRPVPAGTFAPDGRGNASLLLPRLSGARVAKAFGITVEGEGGSPMPTLPILLAGAPS